MIVVRIDLFSARDPSRNRSLATVALFNDGSSRSPDRGNYGVTAQRPGGRRRVGTVADFPRRSRSVLELLRRALNDLHARGDLP